MTPRQLLTSRSTLTIGAVLILLAGCITGFVLLQPPPTIADTVESTEAFPVTTIIAEQVDSFSVPRTYTGVLKARRTSELGFERTGRLTSIEVQEGDAVTKGATLATLDTANLEAQLTQIRAQRRSAKAKLNELVAGPRAETITTAKAEVRDFESRLDLAKADFERVENLWEASAISQREFDSARFEVTSAQGRLDAAQSRLNELESGTRQEQIDAQQANVDQMVAAVETLEVDIKESSIVAPFDAIVSKRMVDEGSIVSPSTPIFRMVERQHLEAWIGVPETIALKYTKTRPATEKADGQVQNSVTLNISGKEYGANLKTILPELDATTRTRTVIFEIPETSHQLLPGTIARIELEGQTSLQGIWLPISALTRGQRGLWSTYVVQQNAENEQVAVRRDVEILHTDTNRILVRGMIDEGDVIVADGTHRITSGQQVQVVEEEVAELETVELETTPNEADGVNGAKD